MDKNSVVAQLYTLRDYIKTPADIYSTLKKVKAIGYPAVQVSAMGPIDPPELKKMADEIGLKIIVTHTPYEALTRDLDQVIRNHHLWNCHHVGLGSMPGEFRGSLEGFRRFIGIASPIAAKIAENGLQFVYHNHRFEFEKFHGKTGMDYLFEETDPKSFGFEIDTYWIQAGGANPVDWIRKVRGRMAVVHLKDMAIQNDQQVYAEIGQGNLDWPAIIEACRQTGVQWYAVEQDICPGNPFDSLALSLRYLEKFF
jgi:sugar phosphate isomerase/epimerase